MIQTDLSSFSYKKGSLVPWCKKCGEQHFYRKGKTSKVSRDTSADAVDSVLSGQAIFPEGTFSVAL